LISINPGSFEVLKTPFSEMTKPSGNEARAILGLKFL
jgi:hypothetical protein